ncbi:MAG: tetratricopeptide repeat protein [Planctomycetota bacterium]|nr:tetratricopeptide repeat protein [Planctomycetota bacterium]
MRFPNPLRPVTSRLSAALWSWCGRRRLQRGDHRGAIRAFHRALERRPQGFPALMSVAQAHLQAREFEEARRFLAQAREADPTRYDLRAAAILARCGYDLDGICRPQIPAPRTAAVAQATRAARRDVTAANLPYGDCQDVDEYARFRAMPPITPAEIEHTDWDSIISDLLDE